MLMVFLCGSSNYYILSKAHCALILRLYFIIQKCHAMIRISVIPVVIRPSVGFLALSNRPLYTLHMRPKSQNICVVPASCPKKLG